MKNKKTRKITAYSKDIRRNILHGRKRFVSIMVITLLGVMMFSGLQASCEDLRVSADTFYDAQGLHDLKVVSTLGLTEEDADALLAAEGVEAAEGIYSEDVTIRSGEKNCDVTLETISAQGMDAPYLTEGRLPAAADETVVTEKFADETGLSVGDSFVIVREETDDDESAADRTEPDSKEVSGEDENAGETAAQENAENSSGENSGTEEDTAIDKEATDTDASDTDASESDADAAVSDLDIDTDIDTNVDTDVDTSDFDVDTDSESTESHILPDTFTITGIVIDPTDVDNPFSQVSFRKNAVETVKAYILPEAEDSDIFTSIILRTAGTEGMECYSDGYESAVADVKERIETDVQPVREAARTEEIREDAREQLADGRETADQKLADAYRQLTDGEKELTDKLADAKQQLTDGEKEIEDGKQQLADGEKELDEAEKELKEKQSSSEAKIADGRSQLTAARKQLTEQITNLTNLQNAMANDPAAAAAAMQSVGASDTGAADSAAMTPESIAENISAMQAQLQSIDQQLAALDEQEAQLQSGIAEGQAKIDENRKTLAEKKEELADAEKKLADGRSEYDKGKEEGEQQLADGWDRYYEAADLVTEKLAEAEEKIDDLDEAQWYVQDRSSLSGYSNVKNDADSIESIGTVFPVVFLAVAILMSLTTIARMVDEDRGLIGTYKSLGFTDGEIRRKYIAYAGLACVIGSAIGTLLAFVVFPEFIFTVFEMMYILPYYRLTVIWPFFCGGPLLFLGGILLATFLACRKELRRTPAILMRPKTPKAGSRVFLEKIPSVWQRMNFLDKVTARNLFRYKGRMLMTIFGIGGCMALLLFGFSIKDSVADLSPRQYGETSRQDLLAVTTAADNDKLLSYIESGCGGEAEENLGAAAAADEEAAPGVRDYINIEISTVRLLYDGSEENVQLVVVPDGEGFDGYAGFTDIDGDTLELKDGVIYVTRNIGNVMGFRAGSTIEMQLADLEKAEIPVTALVKNYLSNYVYMTESTFEQYYDTFEPNAVMLHFSDRCSDLAQQKAYGETLKKQDGILSVTVTSVMKDEFTEAFRLMNIIVIIVIVMSAALAFTVLFTLATTNISERERELATIKVLGFYDGEVHSYIHKETWFLTILGVLIGIPLGRAFAQSLTIVLNLPGIYLAVSLHAASYMISGGLTLFFALLVQFMTNRTLDVIDPVTALKSVE